MLRKFIVLGIILVMIAAALPAVVAQDGDVPWTVGEGPFHWEELENFEGFDMGGEEVVFFGPWTSGDGENLTEVVDVFNSVVTNGSVTYIGSDSLEQQLVIDCDSGDMANVVAPPQPGLAANLASDGCLIPAGDDVQQFVLDNYAAGQSWVDLATYPNEDGEDTFYGIFYNVNVKSLVWFVPDNFDDSGYEIPETWDDLVALSDQIVADGGTPWCIGIGSEAATGWPATDWVEDILLRTAGVDVYYQWTTNDVPFTDPAIINAIETFGSIARNDDYVVGGTAAVATTDFRDSPAGLFTVPPDCYMHRQASFIPAFFPEDVVVGVDADFFYFPPIDEAMGRPVLGGGTVVGMGQDTPATRKFFEWLQSPLSHELWAAQAGFLSPHSGMNLDSYSSAPLRGQAEILLNSDVFAFDGSDLMPGAIGAGTFWTAMVDYVNGASAEDVAAAVQESWDDIQ
jgi:alpha-glucoside transport system substrate-binding protein